MSEPEPVNVPLSGLAVASFWLGLFGLIVFMTGLIWFISIESRLQFGHVAVVAIRFMPTAVVAGIAGIACGHLARLDIRNGARRGSWLRRAGLMLSYTTVISIAVTIVWSVVWFANMIGDI